MRSGRTSERATSSTTDAARSAMARQHEHGVPDRGGALRCGGLVVAPRLVTDAVVSSMICVGDVVGGLDRVQQVRVVDQHGWPDRT